MPHTVESQLACRNCDKVWDWMWAHSDAWERAASNEEVLLPAESDEAATLIERAGEIEESDPAMAFDLYVEAAEAGSVQSMERVGWQLWTGSGVEIDLRAALDYYRRAAGAGSWMATISYARILGELGHHAEAEETLEDGVKADFVPAYFWLAWTRYQRSMTPQSRKEVRPLLEHAAGHGHPAARLFLARWMAFGKFGPFEILRGWKRLVGIAASFAFSRDE